MSHDRVEALKAAVEGECDGLALSDDQARNILDYLASAQAASAEPPVAREMMLPPGATTKERFRVSDDGLGIWDEDFTFDANLKISGDFATEDDKRAYARELVALLNTTPGPAVAPAAVTDDELRKMWRDAGGRFHGPHVETGTMPESLLLPFLRNLATRTPEPQAIGSQQ